MNKITYFDTEQYALTKNDIWLRKIGEVWELRIPIVANSASQCADAQYYNISGEEKIRQIFNVAPESDFEKDISNFGYVSFCVLDEKENVPFLLEQKEAIEYLKRKKPQHFAALVEAGVVNE
ncbi:MAG: hypothetical protein PHW24_04760 [Candidatus Moranbacteria bacterium]|nr:hypothetical protein [Candidatus Moranbacteria bacterium]